MVNTKHIVSSICRIWMILFLIPLSILTIVSFFMSEEFDLYRDTERLIYEKDHPILLLAVLAVFICMIILTLRHNHLSTHAASILVFKRYEKLFVMAIAFTVSLSGLLLLRSKPYMDCVALVEVANQFSRNDYTALSTPAHNSYLYIYAFQIGMVSILETLFRIFGEGNYFSFQLLNIVGAVFFVRNIHEITKLVFNDEVIVNLTDLFLCFCFPLYINVTFVYGDVIGWSLAIGALLCTLRWTIDSRFKHMLSAGVLIAFGVLIKSNDYIFLIAIVIIVVLKTIESHNWKSLLYAVLCVALTIALSASVKTYYVSKANIDDFPKGAPASCWIAMSLIEDENFENGWFNGYNIGTFVENDYDPVKTDIVAKALVRERLVKFIHHPKYALRFFMIKFVSAWNDPQFNSQIKIEWSTRHVENLSSLAKSIIDGKGRRLLFHLMNILHFLIFFGALSGLIILIRRKDRRSQLVAYLILPVIGGMLFHLMWETQARYMIVYYILLFPISSYGYLYIAESFSSLLANKIR